MKEDGAPLVPARTRDRVRSAGQASSQAARSTGRAISSGYRRLSARIHRATHAHGAGESGLAKVIELQALHAAGDALVALGLAGTLFFNVPVGEARPKVALYLVITMAPFALVAPLLGPLLDRVRHGRRYALAATMLIRAFLCWVMADAVDGGGLALYPAAFGTLVASKAHAVTRATVVPRLLPPDITLVRANARVSMAGTLSSLLAAALGAILITIGPEWALRAGFCVFVVGMVLALRLPSRVDSTEGEAKPRRGRRAEDRSRAVNGSSVLMGMRANAALRGFSGFLILYLAFLLRAQPIGALPTATMYALVAGAAAIGSFAGTVMGSMVRARAPEPIIVSLLALQALATVASIFWYGAVSVVALSFMTGFAQQLAKLCLDAIIQRDVADSVRTSVFARTETLLQLAWVVGGILGIALPGSGEIGLSVGGVGLVLAFVLVIRTIVLARRLHAISNS
ncbi:MAG: MFS transporter [Sporichthyaceae bacterium]|nr:MFS transporter [Sporichthyaceae bacterium]